MNPGQVLLSHRLVVWQFGDFGGPKLRHHLLGRLPNANEQGITKSAESYEFAGGSSIVWNISHRNWNSNYRTTGSSRNPSL